jgi:hypothetical protein
MREKRVICAVLITTLVLFALGCTTRQDKAKTQALTTFSELRKEQNGDKAKGLRDRMVKELAGAGLAPKDISVDQAELDKYVRDAYYQDARNTLALLRDKKGDPEGAAKLRDEFYRTEKLAGRSLKDFGTSETEINRIVARNYLTAAAKQGVQLGPEDYKAAGLPVPASVAAASKPRVARTHRAAPASAATHRATPPAAVTPAHPEKPPIGQRPTKKLRPSRS